MAFGKIGSAGLGEDCNDVALRNCGHELTEDALSDRWAADQYDKEDLNDLILAACLRAGEGCEAGVGNPYADEAVEID
jgi:hypothetical protein